MLTQPWLSFEGRCDETIELAEVGMMTTPQGQTLAPGHARPSSKGEAVVRDDFVARLLRVMFQPFDPPAPVDGNGRAAGFRRALDS